MKYIPDTTGRFKERPLLAPQDIEYECEKMILDCLEKRKQADFVPPLDTDTLNVLLEEHAEDVNLYADLQQGGGPGIVEGVTEFRKGRAPRILIDRKLSEQKNLNRLRSTMAHELFHARFHRALWELYWLGNGDPTPASCKEDQIFLSGKVDWYEWQAAYGSGAILMPLLGLERMVGRPTQIAESGTEGLAMIFKVASEFLVSTAAARVRLIQTNYLLDQRKTSVLR
ncbi:MAG: ImmA/IrrE family metallo-endopeptidase [Elusimicrobiota bacterium]